MLNIFWPEASGQTVLSLLIGVFENHRKKVAFNIAIEASYVSILSGQKFIKNVKNGQFEIWNLLSNSVTR